MSVCGQTEEESGSEEPAGVGAGAAAVRDMYEQKAVSKVVRVLTVLAYLLSVSLAAILLSVYYVCVWQSPKLPLALTNETGEEASKRIGDPPPPGYNANASISHPKPSAYYPYPWHESRKYSCSCECISCKLLSFPTSV
ncbi:hypothetical protein O0L34_g939 [Tuta absoluta]|nr:hypothetical protein O0L34_g939 [Tuta absoluta]